jgi:psiF repeat
MRIKGLPLAAALCVLVSGAAHALDAASDATTPVAPRAGGEDAGARSAKSIECSQKADAQSLHGKPRKHFMRECKHGG